MQFGERGCLALGAGKKFEEILEALAIETELWRELPENRAEFWAELEQAVGEEVGKRLLGVAQFQHVREIAWTFDGEDEAGGCRGCPLPEAFRALERIEGAVDFDGGEFAGGEFELAALWKLLRIEDIAPAGVAPTGDADSDCANFLH